MQLQPIGYPQKNASIIVLVLANGFDSVGKQIVIADSENKKSSSPYSYFFVQIRKFSPSPLLILPTELSLYHKRNMLSG